MKKRKKGKEADVHPKKEGDDLVKTLELRKLYDYRPVTSYKSFEYTEEMNHKSSTVKGIVKIESLMGEKHVNKLTIGRQYLTEIFNEDILEYIKGDGLPTLTTFASMDFEKRGIMIKYSGDKVTFKCSARYYSQFK